MRAIATDVEAAGFALLNGVRRERMIPSKPERTFYVVYDNVTGELLSEWLEHPPMAWTYSPSLMELNKGSSWTPNAIKDSARFDTLTCAKKAIDILDETFRLQGLEVDFRIIEVSTKSREVCIHSEVVWSHWDRQTGNGDRK